MELMTTVFKMNSGFQVIGGYSKDVDIDKSKLTEVGIRRVYWPDDSSKIMTVYTDGSNYYIDYTEE